MKKLERIEDFGEFLEDALEIPVAYFKFDQPPTLPYLVYHFRGDDGLHGDNVNYIKHEGILLELYFGDKDFALERKLTDFLIDNKLAYASSADEYIAERDIFAKLYETGMFYK